MNSQLRRGIAAKLFDQRLRLGSVAEVSPNALVVSLQRAGAHDGIHLQGYRHGLGEVGEYIVILSENVIVLAQIVQIETRQSDFKTLDDHQLGEQVVAAQAKAHLLGTINPETLGTAPGIQAYPRIGDQVFSAPALLIANIPQLSSASNGDEQVVLHLGCFADSEVEVKLSPEDLLSRHCAVLGTTGSGKSWTIARLIEELLHYPSKTLLIDSTGEYSSAFNSKTCSNIVRYRVASGVASDKDTTFFPPSSFSEGEYFALFSPSLQIQAPVLTNAITSLRILKVKPEAGNLEGYIDKVQCWSQYKKALTSIEGREAVNNPYGDFDLEKLPQQIVNECLISSHRNDGSPYKPDTKTVGYCESLLMRVRSTISDGKLPFMGNNMAESFADIFSAFIDASDKRLLIIDISELDAVSSVRPIVVNAIGTLLMKRARNHAFQNSPFICVLDEAHNFISKSIGTSDAPTKLGAFEAIAREGRKYGLCLCLATQRPRDLSESVLSQIGTLITHRLTNDYDRTLVERASGDTNSSVTQFLPDLRTGEALIFGTQIPIPFDIQITRPSREPKSNSADFQTAWKQTTKEN